MKKYPIGIQDFQKLREEGYFYVDKTREVFQLIKSGQYYFLSRPRRFGKSLLISTLKYLFQGERGLFEGLWIEGKYDFQPHPVLHFSFSSIGYKTMGLAAALEAKVENLAASHGIELKRETYDQKFAEVLEKLSGGEAKVALLIDEMEFKLDASAGSALKQIWEKRYGSPFLGQDKEVIALGVSFSSADKEVAEWEAVPYETLLVEG